VGGEYPEQRNRRRDVDFPPALQWARRPLWFSWQNLTAWGLGLPLGVLAWAGFLWAGWLSLKGAWRRHILLWGWLAFYFTWQTMQFNPTMRYQLPSYPALAIFAAWAAITLIDGRRRTIDDRRLTADKDEGRGRKRTLRRCFSIVRCRSSSPPSWSTVARSMMFRRPSFVLRRPSSAVYRPSVLLVSLLLAYAFAFSGITAPFTPSPPPWVYQGSRPDQPAHHTEDGVHNQPLPYPAATFTRPALHHQLQAYAAACGGCISGACGQ
jgi:hypothetical protein